MADPFLAAAGSINQRSLTHTKTTAFFFFFAGGGGILCETEFLVNALTFGVLFWVYFFTFSVLFRVCIFIFLGGYFRILEAHPRHKFLK